MGLLYRFFSRRLATAQYEHARWVAIYFEFDKVDCDAEAKIAAEQVVVLRGEVDFYRRVLGWLQRPTKA